MNRLDMLILTSVALSLLAVIVEFYGWTRGWVARVYAVGWLPLASAPTWFTVAFPAFVLSAMLLAFVAWRKME